MNAFTTTTRRARSSALAMIAAAAVATAGVVIPVGSAQAKATGCIPTITQDQVVTSLVSATDGNNDQITAWEQMKVSFGLTGIDDVCDGAQVNIALPSQFDYLAPNTDIPLNDGAGVLVATARVASGSPSTITITMTDYAQGKSGVSVSGWFQQQLNSDLNAATTELVYTVNGETRKEPITVGACTGCTAMPTDAVKWGTNSAGGSTSIGGVTATYPNAGVTVRMTDDLTNGGQSVDCTVLPSMSSFTQKNYWGDPINTVNVPVTVETCTPTQLVWTFVTDQPNAAYTYNLRLNMDMNTPGPWTDQLTVASPGLVQTASASVAKFAAGGQGTGTTPTDPGTGGNTGSGAGTPVPPVAVKMVSTTATFQVDAAAWTRRSVGARYVALAADGKLMPGEGRRAGLWRNRYLTEKVRFVTVTIRHRQGTTVSKAQWVAAVNKATGLRVGSTARNLTAKTTVGKRTSMVTYWMLGKGASAKYPMGKRYTTPQLFLARN